jgi:hypothetical protein
MVKWNQLFNADGRDRRHNIQDEARARQSSRSQLHLHSFTDMDQSFPLLAANAYQLHPSTPKKSPRSRFASNTRSSKLFRASSRRNRSSRRIALS